jgi:7-cyano-7-deazaguanine synthase
MIMNKIAIALSGGMDSVTLLAYALNQGFDVLAVQFQYGSKHNPWEARAFENVIRYYKRHGVHLDFKEANLRQVGALLNSALIDPDKEVPEGHYEEESMRQTVVPGRNLIFASVLTGIAWSNGCSEVWLGVHAGDHFIYPDCRPEFVEAMDRAIQTGTDFKVILKAPYLQINKADIVKRGLALNVPYQLTRTCYKAQPTACGVCGSCQERLWAFNQNGVEDPLEYDSRELLPKKAK